MRRALIACAVAASAACAQERRRAFELGVLGPLAARVEAAARHDGLALAETLPAGAEEADASVALPRTADKRPDARLADWSRLRWLAAGAVARGRSGVYFRLPRPAKGEVTDYPEEWQALTRLSREFAAVRPILERGEEIPSPLPGRPCVSAKAWRFHGRSYVLLVNDSGAPVALDGAGLDPWRALFSVRSDPRDSLVACADGRCLAPEGVLWLEGRLL